MRTKNTVTETSKWFPNDNEVAKLFLIEALEDVWENSVDFLGGSATLF